jgi:hypothetical protein
MEYNNGTRSRTNNVEIQYVVMVAIKAEVKMLNNYESTSISFIVIWEN